MIGWQRKMEKTMKLVIILMNCSVKKKKLILTEVKECLEEEQQSKELEDNVNWQQRYWPRKQLTHNRNVTLTVY